MSSTIGEVWQEMSAYPGYAISNLGRVKSIPRVVSRPNRWGTISQHKVRERILRLGARSGYPLASVHVADKQITLYVHQEVMPMFGPPPPFPGAFVRHLDDVRSHCEIGNLEWGTQADNMADAKRNGRKLGGYRPKGSKVL